MAEAAVKILFGVRTPEEVTVEYVSSASRFNNKDWFLPMAHARSTLPTIGSSAAESIAIASRPIATATIQNAFSNALAPFTAAAAEAMQSWNRTNSYTGMTAKAAFMIPPSETPPPETPSPTFTQVEVTNTPLDTKEEVNVAGIVFGAAVVAAFIIVGGIAIVFKIKSPQSSGGTPPRKEQEMAKV